jgi:hypothetical protein
VKELFADYLISPTIHQLIIPMSKIQSRAMLLSLSISMFSPRKTDKKGTREVLDNHNAADSAGKFVKQIQPEEALETIKKVATEARQWHYENTCPWSDEGARILPSVKYMEYVDKMRGFSRQIAVAIDTSGSIGQTELDEFMAEVRAILFDCRPENMIIIQCDAQIQEWLELDPFDETNIQATGQSRISTYFLAGSSSLAEMRTLVGKLRLKLRAPWHLELRQAWSADARAMLNSFQ